MTHPVDLGTRDAPRLALLRGRGGLTLGVGAALIACLVAAMITAAARGAESQWLGMELEPLSPGIRAGLGLAPEQTGVYVSDAVGAALSSGIREGDVIVAVNGQPVQDLASLRQARQALPASTTPLLSIVRQGRMTSVTLAAGPIAPTMAPPVAAVAPQPPLFPAIPAQAPVIGGAPWGPGCRAAFGAEVATLDGATAGRLGIAAPYRGVVVTGLASGSGATRAGVQPGDLILHVNGYDVLEADQFWSVLAAQPQGGAVGLDVYRGGRLLRISLQAGDPSPVQPAAWGAPCPLR